MRASNLIFGSVQLLHYECHKINFKRCGSYIGSPDLIKKKKLTTNPKNDDDRCFQYAAVIALNHDKIEFHPERVSNIKPVINNCN